MKHVSHIPNTTCIWGRVKNSISTLIASVIVLLTLSVAASAATLLPNGKQIFFKTDGTICSGCSVFMYVPSTTTFKTTWQDAAQTTPNANPVITDSAGMAIIYGSGEYRQLVKDALNNTVWDQLTSDVTAEGVIPFLGTSGGSSNAQTVTNGAFTSSNGQAMAFRAGFTNSGAATLSVSGGAAIPIRKDTAAGPVGLVGNEIVTGNIVVVYYDTSLGVFHLTNNAGVAQLGDANTFAAVQTFSVAPVLSNGVSSTVGPLVAPCGRLTLTSATPVLSADVTAQTTVFYTPYLCNLISLYDGSKWNTISFSEVSQTLADSTKSPAAGGINQVYDMFGWLDGSTFRVTRGPAWTTPTSARGTGAGTTELEYVAGVLVNKVSITNGPSAQRGIYLGSIATDGNGGNGQLNMMFAPAAAAGGTNNRLDVWNMYNRVNVSSLVRDSTNSWNYTTLTWRSMNNSASNRVTMVAGLNEEAVAASVDLSLSSSANVSGYAGIGVDSTTAISGIPGVHRQSGSAPSQVESYYMGLVGLGRHFIQALEASEATGTTTWYGDNNNPNFEQAGLLVYWRM